MSKHLKNSQPACVPSCEPVAAALLNGKTQACREAANDFLEGLCNGDDDAVILRHEVADIRRREFSDWDLASDSPEKLGAEIERKLGVPWLTIQRDYVHQRYYDWGQIDILPKFVWHGLPYLEMDSYHQQLRVGEDGVQRPCLAHDAWIVWMTGLLWGGRFDPRYVDLLDEALSKDEASLRRCAVSAFGRAWGEQLMAWARVGMYQSACEHVKVLRRQLFLNHCRNKPVDSLLSGLRHWSIELKFHCNPPFPWIAILGPDGSGKTAVLNGVREALKPSRIGVRVMHWRPNVFSRKENVDSAVVSNPQGSKPRGLLMSLLKLPMLAMDWWFGAMGAARHARAKHSVWISDRYYCDLEVDPLRYRYGASTKLAGVIFRFFPQPDRVIILTGDAKLIHARKEEVTLDELKRQLGVYQSLANRMKGKAVELDVGSPLKQVVEEATSIVEEACRGRSL